ncbi:MAG: PorT family protein [Cyclobacteriaceae bacterium]|nr:PorT family protein [Cyclobacteriaceae bacterium]
MTFNAKKVTVALILTVGFIICRAPLAYSQVGIVGGVNYSFMRNSVLENDEPAYTWNLGANVELSPKTWKKFSIETRIMFIQKGYRQYADKWYTFHFDYLSVQPTINYSPVKQLSVDAGIDISGLINANVIKWADTYNLTDAGVVFGVSAFRHKRISLYSRIIYGLTPMLEYHAIDEMGNFTGEIKDLKNTCIQVGVRINIYHEKLSF